MLNQKKIESSYGIMRIREAIKTEEENSFNNALENISKVFNSKVSNSNVRSIFENLNILDYKEIAECIKDISLICKFAKENKIYLDRPNDSFSYFIYLVDRYNAAGRAYM